MCISLLAGTFLNALAAALIDASPGVRNLPAAFLTDMTGILFVTANAMSA